MQTRRNFLEAVGAAGLAATAGSCSTLNRRTEAPLNFVVILSDDHAYRALGYNNPVVRTPHMDRLANEGIIFDRVYTASPVCVASRASIATGHFPQRHGAVALNPEPFVKNVIHGKRYVTLAQALATSGYATAFCGKSHIANPIEYGFLYGREHGGYDDTETFACAQELLEQLCGRGRPFLLWVAPRQPHVPLLPAQEWLDLYKDAPIEVDPNFREAPPEGSIYNQGTPGQRFFRDSEYVKNYKNLPSGPPRSRELMREFIRAYYATVSHLDAQIGAFIEQLKRSGCCGRTVVIYLSDNGYLLGNHGLGNKITMHEESVRVPMFVHGTGLRNRGVRCGSLVSSLDLFPTLMDLAGAAPPDNLPGRSIVPLFARPNQPLREYVAGECVGVGGKTGEGHRMVRTDRWKYVLTDVNEEALFDEETDPYELHNVAGEESNRQVLLRMRRYLNEWMAQTGDGHARPPS